MAASQGSAYWQERKYAFRKLLVTVSEKLTESEARQIEFLRELPKSTTRMREGLDVLAELRKRGEFSSKKVQPLIDLLQEIKRHDIAEYVRDSYQATNPDIRQRTYYKRTSSFPPQGASPQPAPRSKRPQTLPEIIITLHGVESRQDQGGDENHVDLLEPPKDLSLSLDDVFLTEQDNSPSHSRPVSPITCNKLKAQLPKPNSDQIGSARESSESRPRTMSDSYPLSQSAKEDDFLQAPQRHSSWSAGTINIKVKVAPVRSTSCEKLKQNPRINLKQFARSYISHSSQESKGRMHMPLTISQSAPDSMACQEKSSTKELEGTVDAEDDSSGLMMKELSESACAPVQHNAKVTFEEQGQGSASRKSYVSSPSPKQVSKLKKLSQRLSLPGKRGGNTKKARRACERSTYCTWNVERESVLHSIWNHKCLDYTLCSEQVPIDIEYESLNPYLSLLLYPYGLFSDKNKSMTLLAKVFIPNDCPPIPVTASFNMSWKISTGKADILECSKKPIKVSFDKGMVYIHKFLPHNVLQQNCCKMLSISIHLSTSYSVHDMDSYSNVMTEETPIKDSQMTQKRSDEILRSFKTAVGNRNIAQEVGEEYLQFGRVLLDDAEGTVTTTIATDITDAPSINQEILKWWLQGKGKHPVQWSTLIEALRDIDMHDLATHIEHNLQIDEHYD